MGQITAQDVLNALDQEDREETEAKAKETAEARASAEAAEAAKKPAPVAAQPAGTGNEALDVAWDIATDSVKDACPDLDDEDLKTARDAAGGSPKRFREIAKRMQDKIKTAKAGAPMKTDAQRQQEIVEKVFGDRPGGDPAQVQHQAAPTAEQKFQTAVKEGDTRGIMRGIAKEVEDKKLLGGTLIVE